MTWLPAGQLDCSGWLPELQFNWWTSTLHDAGNDAIDQKLNGWFEKGS
jgi:hypothetical protein